jgi:hypothetical protein
MPFQSQAQRAFMYSQHPEIARRWRKENGPQRGLPQRLHPKGKHDRRQALIAQFVAKSKR